MENLEKKGIRKVFDPIKTNFCFYWKIYGGKKALFSSPYLYIALGLALISPKFVSGQWHNLAITIIPNMLGFTLGGYAILLSFGGERFFKILCIRCADESTPTPFMIFNGAFVHFIIVQITTLLLSVLCSQYEKTWILVGFIGTFLLYYTLTTALAAVFAIMNMADWYEDQANNEL